MKPAGFRAALMGAAVALGLGSGASADDQCRGDGPRVLVNVHGFRSTRGFVSAEIYPDDASRFLGHLQQVVVAHDPLKGLTATVCLPLPRPGYYALAVYHDEDGDDQFSRGFLGIPKESFGFSNNPPIHLSAPSFDSVRFHAGEGETRLDVRLRHVIGRSVH